MEIEKVERPKPHPPFRYPREADPGGKVPRYGNKKRMAHAAIRGEVIDETQIFRVGTRAGCRDGYAVEEVGGWFEAVKYGPARQTDHGPTGTNREIFFRWPK